MKIINFTIVRIYTYERSEILVPIMTYLKNEANIRGVTVFRAVSGFGGTGMRSTSLMDLSFSLPLIVEFFDVPEKISDVLEHLAPIVKKEHLVFYPAHGFDGEDSK